MFAGPVVHNLWCTQAALHGQLGCVGGEGGKSRYMSKTNNHCERMFMVENPGTEPSRSWEYTLLFLCDFMCKIVCEPMTGKTTDSCYTVRYGVRV
jgi:hypothetical protein